MIKPIINGSVITRLSRVNVDTDKDWRSRRIRELGYPIDLNDATTRQYVIDSLLAISPDEIIVDLPTGDLEYRGIIREGEASDNFNPGELANYSEVSSTWFLGANTFPISCWGTMALAAETIASGTIGKFLVWGYFRKNTWAFNILGGKPNLYVSDVPGGMTTVVPTAVDSYARVVGYSVTANIACFNPSNDVYKIGAGGTVHQVYGYEFDDVEALHNSDFAAADEIIVGTGVGTHNQIAIGASELFGKKAAGPAGNLTAAEVRAILDVEEGATKYPDAGEQPFLDGNLLKLNGIEDGADVTDAVNVNAAGAVMESDYNAQSLLVSITDDNPAPLTVAEQRVVGRITGGNIVSLTGAQIWSILNGTAGANWNLGEVAALLKGALTASGKYSGLAIPGVYGTSLVYGNLIYLASADGRWEKTDASAAATAGGVLLGIALETGSDGDSKLVHMFGPIKKTGWSFTKGAKVCVSTTAGEMTQTVPTGSGEIHRIIGHGYDAADVLFFNASSEWYEVE